MENLQDILQYQFKNENLLTQALTHSSITGNEHKNYEMLEFLGDRVLGMTMAHLLYNMFPNDREGILARRHVKLVCADMVAKVALNLHLENYIKAKDADTIKSTNVLCDVAEAVIGAIYIDSNIENAIAFVERNWRNMIDADLGGQKDYKSQLQEHYNALRIPLPVYELLKKEGSEHRPIFTVRVRFNNELSATGEGTNKKSAEQNAAKNMLELLGENRG